MGEELVYDGYGLVFEDRFEGNALNREHWNVELHEPGWVNEEWQRYVDSEDNIRVRVFTPHQPSRLARAGVQRVQKHTGGFPAVISRVIALSGSTDVDDKNHIQFFNFRCSITFF